MNKRLTLSYELVIFFLKKLIQDATFGSPLIIGDGFNASGKGTAIGVYNSDLFVTGYVYGSNVEFNPRNPSQSQSVSTSTFNTL